MLVGGVLLAGGILKSLEATEFIVHVGRLLLLPARLARFAAPAFLAAECALGAGLIVGLWPSALLPLAIVLLFALAAVSFQGAASGRVEDCGCYGGPIVVTPGESVALNGLYAALLTAAWLAGTAGVATPAARWKVAVVAIAGMTAVVLAETALKYTRKTRRPLVDWSPLKPGRSWRSRWLGDPERFDFSQGEHLVALLSPDCPRCHGWLQALDQIQRRADLPDVVAVYGVTQEEVAALRKRTAFPIVAVSPRRMRRLTRLFPRGVRVVDGVISEVWRGTVPEAFAERVRAGGAD